MNCLQISLDFALSSFITASMDAGYLCRRLCHGFARGMPDGSYPDGYTHRQTPMQAAPQRKPAHAIHRIPASGKCNRRRKIYPDTDRGPCILRFFKAPPPCGEHCASVPFLRVSALSDKSFTVSLYHKSFCPIPASTARPDRKNKCYFTHFAAPFSNASASAAISCTISAAGCSFFTMPAICPAIKQPSLVSPSTAALRSAPTPS